MAHQPELARKTVDHVLKEFNPYNQQALRTRFEIEMLKRDFNAAERALDEVYDTYQPENPFRDLDLARLEVQRGRYQNAMDALDRLEEAGNHAVFTLVYHGLTESEWMALTSTRRLYEHLVALQDAGFRFIAPSDIPEFLKEGKRKIEKPCLTDMPRETPVPSRWRPKRIQRKAVANPCQKCPVSGLKEMKL